MNLELRKQTDRANALLAQCPPKMEIVKRNHNARKSNFDLRALNKHLSNIKKQEYETESESSIVNRLYSIAQKMEEQNIRYRRLVMNEPIMKLVKK